MQFEASFAPADDETNAGLNRINPVFKKYLVFGRLFLGTPSLSVSSIMLDVVEELIRQYSLAEPKRAAGGLRALSGFRYQLLTHLAEFLNEVVERECAPENFSGLSEFFSDFSRDERGTLSLVQCKTTLTRSAMRQAAAEFVHIERFLQSRGVSKDRLTPQFKLFYQRTNEVVLPQWNEITPSLRQSDMSLLGVWQELVDAGRIDSPECKTDPLFDLTKNLKRFTDDPFAVRSELVELALNRGGSSATSLRDELWKVIERAHKRGDLTDCVYLDHQDFLPLQREGALRVGRSPTLAQLRKGEYFDRRDHVLEAEQTLKTADFAPDELNIFWISGRSGSGKSALLLHLMREVVANGDLVAYPREGATSLPSIFRNWPKTSDLSGLPPYLFIDDLYAPNVRDQLSLDSIQSLIMTDGERPWPIIVTCGPSEFKNALQSDFGGKPLNVESWELQPIDSSERESFIQWFEESTGTTAKRGRAALQPDALMISLAHELKHGDLEQFASRFANRLAASRLTDSIRIVLAVNRLYIEAPKSWLTAEEWVWLDELNRHGDFAIESNEIADESFIRLAHPYITDAIYRKVRQPYTALACATDIREAFHRCMEQSGDINSRIGRRILAGIARGETGIDIDEGFLAKECIDLWNTAADRVCDSNPYARADFWLSWCQWEHRRPDLKLAQRLNKVPVEETLAAAGDAHILRHAILARLQELFPNDERVRSAAKAFLLDRSRAEDNGWGFIWQQLLYTAAGNETIELLQVAQEWATDHLHSKSWPRVAQGLLQVRPREKLHDENDLLSMVDFWLSKSQASRSWNFVFAERLEFAHATESQVGKVENVGVEWLEQHLDHPDWSFVWRRLFKFADETQAQALAQLAVGWLARSQLDRGWTYVCEAVADSSSLDDETLPWLASTISDWLAEFPHSPSWGNAWAALSKVKAKLGDIDDAIDIGTAWLLSNQGKSAWRYTLCEFLRLASAPSDFSLRVIPLAVNWSSENSCNENTSEVLRLLLKIGGMKTIEPAHHKLREACIQWLRHEPHLTSHHWPSVFRSAHRLFEDEAFSDIGVAWLGSHETHRDWEVVALAILNSAHVSSSHEDFARLLSDRLQSDRAFVISPQATKKLCNCVRDSVPALQQAVEHRVERLREIRNFINAKRPVVYRAKIIKCIAKQSRTLLVVDIGVPAYLEPAETCEHHQREIGTEISVSPTRCDPKTGVVWVSASRAATNQQRLGFLTSICVGDIVEGRVRHRAPNYVLVTVRDVSVFVHRHELAWQYPPPDPMTEFEDTAKVSLKVTRVDTEKLKITGSIRQAGTHPLEDGTITVGKVLVGIVTELRPFGAILTLPQGIAGLLHQSEIFAQKRGRYYPPVKSVFSIDQKVDVRIRTFDTETGRLELKLPNGPSFQ